LLAFAMTKAMGLDQPVPAAVATLGWRLKLSLILIPAISFAAMVVGQEFPKTERLAAGISNKTMARETLRPMFLLWFALMWLTASTELGPDQWIGSVITNLTGMQGILVLIYTAGVVFLFRSFGAGMAHRMSPIGLLIAASVLSAIGLYGLGAARQPVMVFAAATIFGAGTSYFWPVMLGVTSEQFPKTGPLGLAIMGGTGQLATAFILPVMGRWYDTSGAQAAFQYVAVLPVVLTVVFSMLFLHYRARGGYKPVAIGEDHPVEQASRR
jgi:hypothetical protein